MFDDPTSLYNIMKGNLRTGGSTGSNNGGNWFEKKAQSINNAIGTTGAAFASAVKDAKENRATANLLQDNKTRMNEIAKKYGYNTYHDVWDAREKAEKEGDTKTLELIDNTITPELQGQATANAEKATQKAKKYDYYRKNDTLSKMVNQDSGKFLGSAINTLSTATDVLGLTNGPLSNAVQGGIEGIADELEQNGLRDFDWNRAGQNAISGAVSGAAVGAVNNGISSALAKRGGNLFKGGNAITSAMNNLGANTALGRGASTLATGAVRGGISGAVGGATGAGTSALLNGQDVMANALQGAKQGFQSGVGTGAIMAGANSALNKTKFMQQMNQANQEWQDMGKNNIERIKNVLNDTEPTQTPTETPVQRLAQVAQEAETTEEKPFLAYGESELGNRTKRGMIADKLERLGNSLEGGQTNITRAAAKDLGIESTGKVVENVRKKTGISNLETQAKLAKELTGGENSLLDNIQRNALSASETGEPYVVDTDPLLRQINNIVGKHADTNTFGSEAKRNEFINNLKKDISNGSSDMISTSNRMKANAADLRGRGVTSPKPEDSAKARIYTEIANKLDDLSYSAIPQGNVDAMFDTAISEMRGRAVQARNNGNKDVAKAYETMATNLESQPRTIRAYRTFKKDFVDASKIAELTLRAENGAAAQMGRSFGTGVKRFASTLAQRPVNAALAKVGAGVNELADRIAGDSVTVTPKATPTPVATETPTDYNPATQIYNTIGRREGLTNAEQARTANYLTDAVQANNALMGNAYGDNSLESLVVPTTSNSVYNNVNGNLATATTNNGNNGSYFQKTGDYWTDIIGDALTSAINDRDVTAFAQLYEMYQDQLANLQKNASSTSGQKLNTTQQRANAALTSWQRLSQMTPDLGYNLSNIPIIGGIATLGGNDYEGEAKSLAQQIGYMVSGANIKQEEAENIGKAYVPQPWDSENTRKLKLQRAYEIIQQYQNNIAE